MNFACSDDLITTNSTSSPPKLNAINKNAISSSPAPSKLISMIKNNSNQSSSIINNGTSPVIANFKQHQRHHSYSNPQFVLHQTNQIKHHKRSFSHNSNNFELGLKPCSSINSFTESQKSLNSLNSKLNQSSLLSLDFKGEAINFKATTDSLFDSLNAALEIMQQKEDFFARKFEQDLDRKKKLEEMRQQLNTVQQTNGGTNHPTVFDCGPDYFEEGLRGPNSKIKV